MKHFFVTRETSSLREIARCAGSVNTRIFCVDVRIAVCSAVATDEGVTAVKHSGTIQPHHLNPIAAIYGRECGTSIKHTRHRCNILGVKVG